MKRTITFLSALIISVSTFSQISTNENPPSFKENINKDNIPIVTMPALNYDIINEEDSIDNLNGLPPRFGFDFDADINMKNSGRWMTLPNKKGKIWQLEIYCPGALSINLLYDKFYIPEGGKFFIYSAADQSKRLGAFTYRNNKGEQNDPGAFATSLILNERIILEYYAPANSKEPVISITKVVHGYRYVKIPKSFDDSGNCNVNINCPYGAN